MRLQSDPYLRADHDLPALVRQLDSLYRQIATQVNLLSEGHIQAATNAANAAPTTGEYKRGDQVRNLIPIEVGTAGSKTAVIGWVCIASGNPGTWVQMRVLTGG